MLGGLFDWWVFPMNCTSRPWFWKTPPSTVHSSTPSVWQRIHLWTWRQGTRLHLGFLTANSGMYLKQDLWLISQNHLILSLSLSLFFNCIHLVWFPSNSQMIWISFILNLLALWITITASSQCGPSEPSGVFVMLGQRWQGVALSGPGCFGWKAGQQLVSGLHPPGYDLR